jgi:NAD(P)H dehydrogenase (quinone)
MHAPAAPAYPIATPDIMKDSNGMIFGIPTRFGMVPAQIKALFDSTGGLWQTGALAGKPCGMFFCSGVQHGGQETTVMSTLPYVAHLGMIYVPLGFAHPALMQNDEIMGGSAWGSGTIAGGDGSRQPSAKELECAKVQGKNFAAIAGKLI